MALERSRAELMAQLAALGVVAGDVLVVHTAFSRVGPVSGGPAGLIEALGAAIGPQGTLVMPSMSDDDDHVFDRAISLCRGMGVVAETFWRMLGVLRSDSPHAFAARGVRAAAITAPHPVDVPHGPDSPVGRVHALDGRVLLLGVGHDANTTIHLAEELVGVRYRLPKWAMVREGGCAVRRDYDEPDHCCLNFARMDDWLDAAGQQRRGTVGHAEARLARSVDIVRAAIAHLRLEPLVFLHPPRECAECDAARAASERRGA